jgi:hypothetical protein
LLLHLNLILVTVAVLSLPVTGLIELHIRGFTEELNVKSLLLSDDDGRLEMQVNDGEKLVVTRLKEEVFDVAEQDIWAALVSKLTL